MADNNDLSNIDFGDPALNDTEKSIYDGLGGSEGGDDGTQQVDPNQQSNEGAPSNEGGDGGQQPAQPQSGEGGDGNGQAQQQPREAGRTDRTSRSDRDGNLVDASGNVLARAGAERRLFERAQAQQRYISQLEGRVRDFEQRGNEGNVFSSLPEKKGISLADAELGMDIMANFKKDPLSVARWALQETMQLGYTVEQITDAKGGSPVTPQTIERIIDERLKPLTQQQTATTDDAQVRQRAQEQYDAFVAKHPGAEMHGDAIATVMEGNPDATPEIAYWQLREWVAKQGFDWEQPLREQWEARQRGGNGQQQQQQQPPPQQNGHAQPDNAQQQTRPMPNGAGAPSTMQNGPQFANPDDTWDSIVAMSLREAGVN